MRIAFVTFEYPPFIIGGAGVYAKYVTQELSNMGHDVVVFTPSHTKNEKYNKNISIEYILINRIIPKAFQFWMKLPQVLNQIDKKNKFDIIHFNGLSYCFLQKRLLNCPHILTVHHLVRDAIEYGNPNLLTRFFVYRGENSFIMPIFEKWAIKSVDRIIAVSNFTKNQIMNRYHLDKEKIEIIYNGIDINLSCFSEKDLNDVRNEYNLANKPIILFVGRVDDPRKGLTWLLQAFAEVRKKHDVLLVVVGKGDQTNPKRIARALNILDGIIFTGFIDDILLKKIFKISNLYVCPSQLEGFGLTLLEAFVAGIPVIASKVGALPEIIKYSSNGYLVNYGNIEELVRKINEIISNLDFYNEVNHIDIEKNFNWSNNVKKLLENYKDFITMN